MICTGIHNVSVTFLKAISFISDLSFEQQPQLKFEIFFDQRFTITRIAGLLFCAWGNFTSRTVSASPQTVQKN